MFKYFFVIFLALLGFSINNVFAQSGDTYILFCMTGDVFCKNVDNYLVNNNLDQKYNIVNKDISQDLNNLKEYIQYMQKFDIPKEFKASIPFLVIKNHENNNYVFGDVQIISYFDAITGYNNEDIFLTGNEIILLDAGIEKNLKLNSKSNFKYYFIVIILFLLGLFLGGLYWYSKKKK